MGGGERGHCSFGPFFFGGGGGGWLMIGELGQKEKKSPDFRSPQVGISILLI